MKKLKFEKCGWLWLCLSIILTLIVYQFDLLGIIDIAKTNEMIFVYIFVDLIITMIISVILIALMIIPIWNLFAKKE